MAWQHLIQPITTAEALSQGITQRFRHPSSNIVVAGVIAGFVGINNPSFTNLKMQIYSDRSSSPGKLIAESTNVWTKAQIHTLDNFLKWAGFSFNHVQLLAGEWYHLVLVPTAYTGVDGSYIAWRYSYPDPQYTITGNHDTVDAVKHHLEFNLMGYKIGADE